MDPEVKDEAIRRLQEEIRKEEEAAELAKQKVLEEQKAAEARIHEEFIRLRAEEERIRIEAEKLALQAQAKQLAEQKEAAIQAELERLRNRTPLEVLRDDFKLLVKKLSKLETKPDHTEPISSLETKLYLVSEVNKSLQEQITALSQRNAALSTELVAVKTAKEKDEAALLERVAFIEDTMLRMSSANNFHDVNNCRPDLLKRKAVRQGVRKYNILKQLTDPNPITLKFTSNYGAPTIQLRFVRTDSMLYLSHQVQPNVRSHLSVMSAEKPFGASPFLTAHHGQNHNLNFQIWVYPNKIILKAANGVETYTYVPEGIQGTNNEFFGWSEMTVDLSGATGVSCTELT